MRWRTSPPGSDNAWDPEQRSGGVRRRAGAHILKILELTLIAVLGHISFAGIRVNLSLAAIAADAAPLVIGLLLSAYSLVPTLMSVSGGRWVDRIGVRRPLFIGTALMIVGGFASGLVSGLPMLFVTAVLVGTGFLLSQLVVQKLVGDLGDGAEARRRNFSMLAIGFSVSGIVGPASTGLLVDAIGGRETFLVLTSLCVIVMFWLLLRRRHLLGPGAAVAARRRFTDLLKTPELRRLYLAVGLISSAWDVHQFVVPIYGSSIGLSASQIGLVLGAFGVATLVVRLLLPLAKGLSEWRALLLAQAVATVIFVAYPFFDTFHVLSALSFALGMGLGISQPMALSLMHRVTPPGRIGEAAGLRLMIVNGTQTVLPGVFGVLGSVVGVGLLFWTVGAMVGVGVLVQARARYNEGR